MVLASRVSEREARRSGLIWLRPLKMGSIPVVQYETKGYKRVDIARIIGAHTRTHKDITRLRRTAVTSLLPEFFFFFFFFFKLFLNL